MMQNQQDFNAHRGFTLGQSASNISFASPAGSTTSVTSGVNQITLNVPQFGVPGVSTDQGEPSTAPPQKRKRSEEAPRKPQLSQSSLDKYRICRNLMVKRVKWVAYCDQPEQYKNLKVLPVYCQVTRPVPQIWSNDDKFSSWWDKQISELQVSLFNNIVTSANIKANSYLHQEREAIEQPGKDLSGKEIEEAKGALQTLESRLKATESNSRRVALARDIGGKPTSAPRSKKNINRKPRSKGPFKSNKTRTGNKQNSRAGEKRKAPDSRQASDSDTRLAELIISSIRAAKAK
jgi:hypothetical protein